MKKIALIMAGGYGLKFWPTSTPQHPKQFIHLFDEGTMIQQTYRRLVNNAFYGEPFFKAEDIFVVTFEEHKDLVLEQLPEIKKDNIILEPFGKGTLPCIALSLAKLKNIYDDAVLMIFPSDHIIDSIYKFQESLDTAYNFLQKKEGIIIIGITPTKPEPSYGYVQIKNDNTGIEEFYDKNVRYSNTFAEKPDYDTAKRFVQSGDFFWNSGIFISTLNLFWTSIEKYAPEIFPFFHQIYHYINEPYIKDIINGNFRQLENISFDKGILEKAQNVFVVQSDFGWSDLGSWDELFRYSKRDANNNFLEGHIVTHNVTNSLVRADNKLVVCIGIDNLIVVESENAILICKKGQSNEIMNIIHNLIQKSTINLTNYNQ